MEGVERGIDLLRYLYILYLFMTYRLMIIMKIIVTRVLSSCLKRRKHVLDVHRAYM